MHKYKCKQCKYKFTSKDKKLDVVCKCGSLSIDDICTKQCSFQRKRKALIDEQLARPYSTIYSTAYDGFRVSEKHVTFGTLFLKRLGENAHFYMNPLENSVLVLPSEDGTKLSIQIYRSKKHLQALREGRYEFSEEYDIGFKYTLTSFIPPNNFGSTA